MKLGYPLRYFTTRLLQIFRDFLEFLHSIKANIISLPYLGKKVNKINSLLVVYKGAVGDAYNVIGLLNALNRRYSNVKIYYLTTESNRKFVKSPKINLLNLNQAKELIDKKKFDALILLQGSTLTKEIFDNEFRFKMLKVPHRIFVEEAQIHPVFLIKQFFPIFFTKRLSSFNKNGFEQHLETFKSLNFELNVPEFYYTRQGENFTKNFFKKYRISKKEKLIFMHPGAGTILKALREHKEPSHFWPSQRWADVANELIEKYKARIIFTGMPEEKELISRILKKIKNKKKVIDASGITKSVEDAASLVKKGSLLITIDTGMAHIGGQTKIPLIDLFGPVWPGACSPIGKSIDLFHKEVCNSCRKYACPEGNAICMKAISVKEVLEAANHLLNK